MAEGLGNGGGEGVANPVAAEVMGILHGEFPKVLSPR